MNATRGTFLPDRDVVLQPTGQPGIYTVSNDDSIYRKLDRTKVVSDILRRYLTTEQLSLMAEVGQVINESKSHNP